MTRYFAPSIGRGPGDPHPPTALYNVAPTAVVPEPANLCSRSGGGPSRWVGIETQPTRPACVAAGVTAPAAAHSHPRLPINPYVMRPLGKTFLVDIGGQQ